MLLPQVGVLKARQLAAKHRLPLVPVHHMEAHALVARLGATPFALEVAAGEATAGAPAGSSAAVDSGAAGTSGADHVGAPAAADTQAAAAAAGQAEAELVQFPFLCLLISGGHNLLLLVEGVGQYVQLGTTLDDALGEAYDKVARLLGLDLRPSGGAALEAFARGGNPAALPLSVPMQRRPTCDFSYAGLKTAVRLAIEERCPEATGEARLGRLRPTIPDGLPHACGLSLHVPACLPCPGWLPAAYCMPYAALRAASQPSPSRAHANVLLRPATPAARRGQPPAARRHRRLLPAGGGAAPGGAVPAGGAVGAGVAPRGKAGAPLQWSAAGHPGVARCWRAASPQPACWPRRDEPASA